ncbi:MAG: Mut7-C RNAse domain-containing protein [Bacillota bacterium]
MIKKVILRLFGDLNYFLKDSDKLYREISFKDRQTIKDILEGLKIPHTEVYLLLKNNKAISLDYLVQDGDKISVYPVFKSIDIEDDISTIRKKYSSYPKFIADAHLGKLVSYLRILGFDILYHNDYGDKYLAEKSKEDNRILLTRDHGLLMRRVVNYGYFIREDNPKDQLKEVIIRYNLINYVNYTSRCPKCNSELEKIKKEKIIDRLEPKTKKYYNNFFICPSCDQIYWKGSHFRRINEMIENIKDGINNGL